MAETKTVNLNVETNLGSLKSQLKEAQREVEALSEKFGVTSKEATTAARKAAELKDAIGDAKALTDAFNPDAKFNALSTSLGGVASGFAAYQGAMGLVGVESKELEAQLLKVQSAMALSQGLQAIGEARDSFSQLAAVIKTSVINAFSSLKTALITTGIGALVIGIGLLVANFDKLKNSISKNLADAQKFVDSTKRQGDAARSTANDFAEYERTLKRLGYTEDQIYKKRGEKLKGAISGTEREIEANKKLYKEQLANLDTVYKFDKIGLNATGRALYGSEEDAQKTRENISNLRKELVKLKNDQFEYDEQQKKSKEQDDKTTEAVVKNTKQKVLAKEEDKSKNQELIDNANALNEALAESDAARQKAKEDQAVADAKMRADGLEKLKEDARKQLEINRQLQEQKIKAVQDGLTTIANIAELFAGKSRKQQQIAFNIQKGANIANATIDTYKAVQNAIASTPGGPIIKGLAGAAMLTAGLLNIKKIASTKFDAGGSTGGGGGSTPSSGGGGSSGVGNVIAPNFSIVGANGTNQLEQLKQAPIQAYVVSGEMSTQQSLDRNRLRNATL
jgi:chromosome segregation ATPase